MIQVLGLCKTANTDPQEFTVVLKDLENTQKGYIQRTEHGAEPAVRTLLKNVGMSEPEVDSLFNHAQACP